MKIFLKRTGSKKYTRFNFCVGEQANVVEILGYVDQHRFKPKDENNVYTKMDFDIDKYADWLSKGAQPNESLIKYITAFCTKHNLVQPLPLTPEVPEEAEVADETEGSEESAEATESE